jgi:hypothetical protein
MEWLAEQYGNLASLLGLTVSIATLIVAALTRARIESARKELLARVDTTEALWSLGNIDTVLAELLIYCDAMDWAFATDRCTAALRLLHSLKRSDTFAATALMTIRRGIDDLREVLDALTVKQERRDKHKLERKKRRAVSDISVAIADIRTTINRLIREE